MFKLLCLILSFSALSLTIQVKSLCQDKVAAENQLNYADSSVAEITKFFLEENRINHDMTDNSVISIFNTPTGFDSYDIISDEEMYAYGWCYTVNGEVPDKLMDEVFVSNGDIVTWFYGAAHYLRGEWLTYCTPSHELQWEKICSL